MMFGMELITGVGFTVMLKAVESVQPLADATTEIVAVLISEELLTALNEGINSSLFSIKPIASPLNVQLKVVPATAEVKSICEIVSPLHTVMFGMELITGVGFTVMVKVVESVQPLADDTTEIVAVLITEELLTAVNEGINSSLFSINPIASPVIVQLKVVPATAETKSI